MRRCRRRGASDRIRLACGGGDRSDESKAVQQSVRSERHWLSPTKDTTRLRTVVVASARNMTGGASPPMMCTSSGRLEEKINLQVQASAAAAVKKN